jgi:Integral membrane protein TerC family
MSAAGSSLIQSPRLNMQNVDGLTRPLFSIGAFDVTGRTLILVSGGLFLFVKSTHEIHDRIEGGEEQGKVVAAPSLLAVLAQTVLLDVVFSLDSVITAVGREERNEERKRIRQGVATLRELIIRRSIAT